MRQSGPHLVPPPKSPRIGTKAMTQNAPVPAPAVAVAGENAIALVDAATATGGPDCPIALDKIRIDERVQARAQIVPEVVDEYTEAMREGDEFPPLAVFQEG